MAYLIQYLFPLLLIAALFAGVAGWCWHCIRNKERFEKLISARDRLRSELTTLTPPLPGWRGMAPDPELEAAQMRADVAVSKVVELERERADLVEERNRLSARANELEMALAARGVDANGEDVRLRFAALEDERDAALRELEAARAQWAQERESMTLAPPAIAAQPAEPDLEARANAWRVRLLEGRTDYLESRLSAARALAEREDPRLGELERGKASLEADLAAAQAEIAALKARPTPPTTPAAPENDLNLLRWQSRYLGGRVKYLEDQVRATPAPIQTVVAPPPAEPSVIDVEASNRRAWRQRYLEARLAYYEGRWREDRALRIAALDDLKARDGRVEALERELAAARDNGEQARTRLGELEAAETSLRQDLSNAEAAKASLTQDRASLLARLAEFDAQAMQLASIKAQIADRDAISRELLAARAELGALKTAVSERDAEIARLSETPRAVADDSEVMHLRFRTRYLDDRVKFLEARLAAQPTPRAPATPRQTFLPSQPGADEVRPVAMAAARGGAPDDLRLIDGVSPRIESTLNSIGVYHFDQIAAWSAENVAWVERYLAFRGRIGRERWVEQARTLTQVEGVDGRRRYREDEPV